MNGYEKRDEVLRSMGFRSYTAYLQSPVWGKIRSRVYAAKGKRRRTCPAPATCVHHTSYKSVVLRGKDISPLFPLCGDCHKAVEFDETGRKRDMNEVQKVFNDRKKDVPAPPPPVRKTKKSGKGCGCMTCGKRIGLSAVKIGVHVYRPFCGTCRAALEAAMSRDGFVLNLSSQSKACAQARAAGYRALKSATPAR